MTTFLIITAAVIGLIIWGTINKNNKLKKLKNNYEEALKGTDKKIALAAGRAYYSALRKDGSLTIYDEQAINNDINTM